MTLEPDSLPSAELFRRYFDLGLFGIAVASPTRGLVEVNPRFCELLGYTLDELRAVTMVDLTHPDDLAADVALYERLLAGEIDTYDLEKRFIRKDGTTLTSHLFVTCLRSDDATVDYVVAHIQDIGSRKRAERLVRLQRIMTMALAAARSIEEAARLCVRTAIEATGADIGGMYLMESSTGSVRLVHSEGADPAFFASVSAFEAGSPVQQMVLTGRPIYSGTTTLPKELTDQLRSEMLSGGAVPILHDGKVIACLNIGSHSMPELPQASRTALEGIAGIAGAVISRILAEQALLERERQYRELFETAQVGIFRSRLEDGMFLAVNPCGARLAGFDQPEELIGRVRWSDILKGGRRKELVDKLKRDGKVAEHEMRWHLQDGRALDMALSARLDLDEGVIEGVAMDVTEVKLARAELEEAHDELERRVKERTSELETFAYSVSHDLRAPLRSIDGFSLVLMEDHADRLNNEGLKLLATVRRAAQRMGQIIDDLLSLSRAGRADMTMQEVNLSHVAGRILQHLREEEPERTVEIEIEPSLMVSGDLRLLRITLENLLGNAWKYSSPRAVARIEMGRADPDAASAMGRSGAEILYVRDNGVGFDMAFADKLFGPFQRLHAHDEFPGTGIGLATVQRIIHRHGGEIWADSTVGRGTTFFFTVPMR